MPIVTGRSPTKNVIDIAVDEDGKLLLGGTIPISGTITATTTPQTAIGISGVSVTVPVSGFPSSIGISGVSVTVPVSGFPTSFTLSGESAVLSAVITSAVTLSAVITSAVTLTAIISTAVTASLTNILSAVATVSHPEWDEAVLAYKSTGTSALTSVTYNLAASPVSVVTLGYDADDKIITVTKT